MTPQQFADFASWLESAWRVEVTGWDRHLEVDQVRYVVSSRSRLPVVHDLEPGVICYGLQVVDVRATQHDGRGVHFRLEIGRQG
jgi:hypothetical protein